MMTDTMPFENSNHGSSLLQGLKLLYDHQELVDVTLTVESQTYKCHRNVLAATSPYFKAMFTTELTEKGKDVIRLYDVDPLSMQLIITYAYTGEIDINKNNAQNLLAAASLFQILPVQKACANFMETQLDVTNCVGIHYFAQIHNCNDLRVKSMEHIEKNFVHVSHEEEFLSLSCDKIVDIISTNDLNVEKEEHVFEAVLRWVTHNEADRAELLCRLLPHVRLCLISAKYLQHNIVSNPLVSNCKHCLQTIFDAQEYEQNPESYSGESDIILTLRSGMIKPETCILFIGGVEQSRPSTCINCYNPLTRETFSMAPLHNQGQSGFFEVEDPSCVVTDDNQIFVAGGTYIYRETFGECHSDDDDSLDDYNGEETVRNDMYMYDNDHDQWLMCAPMLFAKANFALAYVDGKIYCFGGVSENQHPTEIIERYDINQNKWSYVGMMPATLVDLSAVVYGGCIYILGGRTGVGAHNVVMKYDPSTADWINLAGMPTPRFNFGACVVGDEIFVAGGQIYSHSSHTINREALNSVEVYNIEQNQWRQGPELPEEVYNVGLFNIHNKLYACGTTEYRRSMFRIYRYNVVYKLDIVKNSWEQIETDLSEVRDFVCVAAKMHTRKLSQVFRPDVDT